MASVNSCVLDDFVLVLLARNWHLGRIAFPLGGPDASFDVGTMDLIKSIAVFAANHRKRTGRPFVTLSYAQSLDGCISAKPGEAFALSGSQSLTLTHQLRASHEAILVGIGTVFSDDPQLTVRHVRGKDPRPVVVDSRLRLPLDCKLLKDNSRSPLVVTRSNPDARRRRALEAAGAQVIPLPANDRGQVDLGVMLNRLAEMGINSLMVEGGARIITNFLLERLADYIVLTVAPVLLGGLRAVSDLGDHDPDRFRRLRNLGHKWLGEDLIVWGALG
jgi:3,4-dihydroxy 2-butanone 4-phosphate synthase/GTP cyclohydrolase II